MNDEVTPLSLNSREGIALLFAVATILLVAFLTYRGWATSGRRESQLDVTQQIVSRTDALLLAVTKAETGQRGYLLTGEDNYLEPYRQARSEIPAILLSLAKATKPHPEQAERVGRLGGAVNEKLAELAATIELRRHKGFSAAVAVVLSDTGRKRMEKIQDICSEILAVTNARLSQYSQEAQSSVHEGGRIAILGGACLFFLLIVATLAIKKGVARRQFLIGNLQQGERRLENAASVSEAANQAKSVFLSTMSHEIRTPMNAILGYAQLMLRDPSLGAEAKTNLKIIGRSGEHLLSIINDVLDMSKIEAGRTEVSPVTFNLDQLLNDLTAMFRLRAEAKALVFELVSDGNQVAYVVADESKIRQVLVNLLGNAVKFTQTGKVTLRASLEQKSADELWLLASVEDTGFGLAADEQAKLFQPFSQTSRGIHSQEGTGLGLAISRKCARLMGGDVTVTSNPGEGSTFRFEIPVGRGEAGVALKRTVPRRVVGIQGGAESPRILVVDDQLENRDWLTKLLTLVGFTVQAAENGEVAIRTCDEWKPQLILMDMHMPVMNGLEATRIIKARPSGKETTIVTLTASALDQDRHTVLESGADDFLSKPCREEELLEKMGSLLHIVYDYEESDKTDNPPSPGLTALSAATLDQLPAGIIEELREATSNGSKKRLNQLIARVREIDHAGPADALQELANKYEYDTLTKLLEEASQHSSSQRS